ncbi:MAG: YggT family protein [Pseudomonadota bacterium]
MNFAGAFRFIVAALISLYIFVFVIRFLMQWSKADFRNQLAQAIVQISNPLVKPLRKFIPGWGGLDIATLVVIYVLEVIAIILLVSIDTGFSAPLALGVKTLSYAALRMFHAFINVSIFLIFVRIILSWISPGNYNPIISVIYSITEPMMAPFRRLLPPLGGLDISPIILLLGLSALKVLLPLPGFIA